MRAEKTSIRYQVSGIRLANFIEITPSKEIDGVVRLTYLSILDAPLSQQTPNR